MTKVCLKCKENKALLQFNKHKHHADGYQNICKTCCSLYKRDYYLRNKEKIKAQTKKRYWNNPVAARNWYLKYRYNLSPEDHRQLFEKQKGVCALCFSPCSYSKELIVDHCHITNKVRGLLCNNCNRGIGLLKENIDVLKRAIVYLSNEKI